MFGLGELPSEYNPKVHGPYDPAIYYGKKDTPLSEVKVRDLPSWLSRRNKTPTAIGRAISRSYWRWSHKYVFPRNTGGLTACLQVLAVACTLSYIINSNTILAHKNRKYHW